MGELMSNTEEKRLVPQLRFPGFEGDWEIVKAGSLFTNSSLKGSSGLPIYSVTMNDGMVERASLERHGDDIADPAGNRGVKAGEIAYNMMRMWQGAVGVAPVDCMISPAYVVLSPQEDVDSFFYNILFKSKKYLYHLISHSQGITSDRLRLYYRDFAQIKLPFPVHTEQRKVSSFFSIIDSKISLLSKKKELMEQYKKGMMQKIFSREIRFKDTSTSLSASGEDFPDWEEVHIKDILTIGSGRDYTHLADGEIPVYGTGGYMKSVSDYLYDGETVCIGRKGTIDKPMFLKGKIWTVDTLFFTHSFKNSLPFFIYLVFQQINWKLYNEASGVPSLSKATINSIKTLLPKVSEQEKINSFFSLVDLKIRGIEKELMAAQEFKKGLLQKMFV